MPEWLVECGIGETRAALVENGRIVEARILIAGITRTGTRLPARLKALRPRAIAEAAGEEFLLPKGVTGVPEGAAIVIEVTRERIPGSEPWKRALATVIDLPPAEAPLVEGELVPFPNPSDRLGAAGWFDLMEEARGGIVRFAGGELRIEPTAAMTVIDVDGYLPAEELAVTGAREASLAIRRLDIGGSIGIDLPTSGSKAARQRAAAEVDAVLPQPFERTAVNGFGFIQIVRPRLRPSLVELAQDRAAFEARALLRRIAFEEPGPKRLIGHPAVVKVLENREQWRSELARQIGGAIQLRADATLPMSGGYAEKT